MGETCKLCLKYIQGDTVAALDEDLLAKLDFIQMDLERSVEESNSICTECKEKIQNAFDFKFCLVQTGSDEREASGSQTQNICDIPSTSSGESSTEKTICHLCKNFVAVISVISLEKLLKDDNVMEVFQGHIPELELQKSENSMVCEPCQKALASFSMLVSSWSIANDWNEDGDDMKEDMNDFGAVEVKKEDGDELSDSNTNSSCAVDASDSGKIVKKAKGNRGQVTKVKTESDEESDSSESVSVNSKDVKKEENEEEDKEADLQLKDEEVDIKDEDGFSLNGDEPDPYLRGTNIGHFGIKLNVSMRSQKILKNNEKATVHKSHEQVQLFKCNQCPYETNRKGNLKKHEIVHKLEIQWLRCELCSYKTKVEEYLKQHNLGHGSPDEIELFRCNQCPYKTKRRQDFKRHEIVHKCVRETHLFQCSYCPFKTKWKENLKTHEKNHTGVGEIDLLRCNYCPYSTKRKSNLKQHSLVHKTIDEIQLFRCNLCPYETKWKVALKIHEVVHKTAGETESFRCKQCPFETKRKQNLKQHSLVHKRVDEIQLFRCHHCSFQSKWNGVLKKHARVHKSVDEIESFRCNQCPYETKWKEALKTHLKVHVREKQ